MAWQRLRAGLVGLGGPGRELFAALRAERAIELVAVADREAGLAAKLAEQEGAAAYDDYRLLIVESAKARLDLLFVALPVFETEDYLPLAAERKLPVLVVPPFARRFDTAVELALAFSRQGCPLVVARSWKLESESFGPGDTAPGPGGHLFAAEGHVTVTPGPTLGWLGDSRRAGGGVLLNGGYEMVDAVVALMGVPDAVFAAIGFLTPVETPRTYDTEDSAAMVFRYADDRAAAITVRRDVKGQDWRLRLCGSQRAVVVTRGAADRGANPFTAAVSAFAGAVPVGVIRPASPVADQLGTVATLSAAYLSVRTGQAESPHKFLELGASGRH